MNIDGIQRLMKPVVRQSANGKRTFSDVTICAVKSRKFESEYRGNATGASTWVYYSPTITSYSDEMCRFHIIQLGVGWLALLILTWRQCESLTAGIGAEKQTPTSFFISIFN